jgi:hypothetical protein
MPPSKRPRDEADSIKSSNSSPKAEHAKPKPTSSKKRKIGKREARLQWIKENAPDISISKEFKSNPNLRYMDIARLYFTDSKLQEWATKINEFAQANPDTVSSSTPIDHEEPEFSDPDLEEEYECYKLNYPESTPPTPTPDRGQAKREWVDVLLAEMEIFLGIGLEPEGAVHC